MKKLFWAFGLVLLAASAALSQRDGYQRVGPIRGGGFLGATGQTIEPAGKEFLLDTFPMAAQITPNRRHLLILHGRSNRPTLSVFDPGSMNELSRVSFPDSWLGMAIHPNGHTVYVGGASRHTVHELTLSDEGKLEPSRVFEVTPAAERKPTDLLGDLALSPDGRLVFVTDLHNNAIKVINPQSGRVIENWKTARRPYKILFHPDGKTFFVSSWADGMVTQHDAQSGAVVNRVLAGPHATDMVWREKRTSDEEGESNQFKGRIFVTLGNTNTVRVLGVNETREMRSIESINVGLYPNSPAGMTPSALALSEDKDTLYVVCSDANAVAAVNVAGGRSRVEGFIPTGWYPTAARALDDKRLLVLNGKGTSATGGRTQPGSAMVVNTADAADLIGWTDQVKRNTPYTQERSFLGHRGDATVVPAHNSDRSPIEHVVYIVKGNWTYDQVLGDIGKGNGNPSLASLGAKITPNHHKLANEFVLLDNFYVNGDSSTEGEYWSTAAIAPDYIQRVPSSVRNSTGLEPEAMPPAGYIWSNVLAKGLRLRNYGFQATNIPLKDVKDNLHVGVVPDPVLARHTNHAYRAGDPDYLDIDRAKAFVTDLGRMEGEKRFPNLAILRLGCELPLGRSSGKRTAVAQAADNDAAIGMIVEALTRSSFWPKMAIFVLESGGQNGRDHVDSHRSPAFVISPYSKRAAIDSTFYNTTSILRTMELILGLNPMTMHDAGARPMLGVFQNAPDLKPYSAEKPNVSLEERTAGNQ